MDYIPLEKVYKYDDIKGFYKNFYESIKLIGELNQPSFNKFYRFENIIGDMTDRQKYKLGICILHRALQKSYSKQKIQKTIRVICYGNDNVTIRITPSAKLFRKLVAATYLILSQSQREDLKNKVVKLDNYNRIKNEFLTIAPIHSDIIISSDGSFKKPNDRAVVSLVNSVRI